MRLNVLLSEKIITLPNCLSFLRILLMPVFGYSLYLEGTTGIKEYKYLTLSIVGLIILTDFLDGYFARLLNQESKIGQFLDPIADKIVCTLGLFLLYIYKDFPLWIVILMLLRDIYSIVGGIIIFSNRDIQVKPNKFGKIMVACIGLSAIIYILSPSYSLYGLTFQLTSVILIITFLLLSTILYWKTYSKVYFENKT
ncbi:MAG: CDP-alcohol phosphatidyltransferase family protein [Spirochaetota bacterium]|nr:CDP-alcohol phosphatidyltransferase family protein [Spirochaetota bacterium]